MKTSAAQCFIIYMILTFLLTGVMLFFACNFRGIDSSSVNATSTIRKDGELDFVSPDGSILASIDIEVADTPETQAKGLMARSSLDYTKGMLFVFEKLKPQKFRMQNTLISLDIIFIGGKGCVVNISEFTTPMSDSKYRSAGPIKYTVEVRAGFAKRFQIKVGTCMRWRRE